MVVVRDRPPVWESLDAFAFDRDQAAHPPIWVTCIVAAPVRAGVPCGAGVKTVGERLDYGPFAKISNAFLKGGNRFLPMRSARLSIPRAAFGLKKYFCGTPPFSITSHNEDSLARLGDSEVCAIKHTPSHTIPELGQRSNNDCEVSPSVGREEAWNVFDNTNCGAAVLKKPTKLTKQSRLLPSKPRSRPHACQRDILAWESSGPDIGNGDGCSAGDFFNVLVLLNVRPVLCEDRPAERIDFALVRNLETCSFEPKVEPSNP